MRLLDSAAQLLRLTLICPVLAFRLVVFLPYEPLLSCLLQHLLIQLLLWSDMVQTLHRLLEFALSKDLHLFLVILINSLFQLSLVTEVTVVRILMLVLQVFVELP